MSTKPPVPPPFPGGKASKRRGWQFSLRTLLIACTAAAVFFWLVSWLPILTQILIGLVEVATVGVLVVGVVFARGDQQAFCIGAAVVVTSMWTGVGARLIDALYHLLRLGGPLPLLKFLIVLAVAAANGWVCVRARRYFEAA